MNVTHTVGGAVAADCPNAGSGGFPNAIGAAAAARPADLPLANAAGV